MNVRIVHSRFHCIPLSFITVSISYSLLTISDFLLRVFSSHPFCGSVRLGLVIFYNVFVLALLLSPVARYALVFSLCPRLLFL